MATRKQIAFRTTEEIDKKLSELETAMSMTRQDILNGLIVAEYDKIKGNPEIMKLLEKMNELKSHLETYTKGGQDGEK